MPSLLATILSRAAVDLRDAKARFAVVGGLAVAARSTLRFTQDVDLVVAVTDDSEAERIGGTLIRAGYRPLAEVDQDAVGRLATLRFLSPHIPPQTLLTDAPLLDLIFSTCGIEPETVDAATSIELLDGLIMPAARIPHLIAMKLLSESDGRLQDRIDLKALMASATSAEIQEVSTLIRLIESRGYSRGKNLDEVFQRFRTA